MANQEKDESITGGLCNCPICAIERVYLEAAALKLDAEILALIEGEK